ncbi:hypothetical protein FPCIR_9689 [Fusarium pseudocircinatum]|uniref:Uncharacterized protein n=1 Tax=Fusarium pseudocircinatum TaxID=56676 RepID=A0A8H5KZT3_9HYPO|nr:hypothetical protein FPCIR_9689 [Fusarium pseudocircinatum]
MATNAPTAMPRIGVSYSTFVEFLCRINKGAFRDASIDALGKVQKVHQAQSRILKSYPDLTTVSLGTVRPPFSRYPSQNEIDELLGDLRSVKYFLFDMARHFYSGHENERNMLQPLEKVTVSLERQLYCIQLAINKLDPYRGPKDIFGMYCGVLVDENLARTDREGGTGRIEEQMQQIAI